MSNSSLAARISALVDKWNAYKNQLRDLLTKATGTVDMEDGTGTIVTLPTFPALQASVTDLTDSLTGAVAQATDLNSQTVAYANQAEDSATASSGFADAAAASAAASDASRIASASSAEAASTSASAAAASVAEAANEAHEATISASTASSYADSAGVYRDAAGDAANASAASAAQSASSATSSADSADEAHSWALTAQTAVTGLLVYRGAFDASSGSFPETPNKGDFWKIGGAGVIDATDLAVGDQIIYSGTGWDKIDNTESVTAVAGRVGDITLSIPDIGGLGAALTALVKNDSANVIALGWINGNLRARVDSSTWNLWHSGNFDPSTKADLNSPNASFNGGVSANGTLRATSAYTPVGGAGVEIYRYVDGVGNVLAYDRNTGSYIPLDIRGSTVTLEANGTDALIAEAAGIKAPGYIQALGTLYATSEFRRRNPQNTAWFPQPTIFVQSADPGANAASNDLWIW